MCKLLTGLHAVLRDGKPFDASRLLAQTQTAEADA
jgi:hypothetical protein